MKYIRTKDGIYDKIDEHLQLASNPPQYRLHKNGEFVGYVFCKDCKLADTIEELVDEYVIHYANGYHLITINDGEITFKDDFDYGFKLKFALENGYEIYGSIWVGADLHSVAKMNKKGELELL